MVSTASSVAVARTLGAAGDVRADPALLVVARIRTVVEQKMLRAESLRHTGLRLLVENDRLEAPALEAMVELSPEAPASLTVRESSETAVWHRSHSPAVVERDLRTLTHCRQLVQKVALRRTAKRLSCWRC